MSDAAPAAAKLITELQASAHLMLLDAGIYCVHHTPGSMPPDPETGLPGARLSVPPGATGQGVAITGFRDDGWLGSLDSAALIRVSNGPAQVLMTIYMAKDSTHEPPRLQVTRLVEGSLAAPAARALEPLSTAAPLAAAPSAPEPAPPADAEIAAHVQLRGDVLARLGEWVGERGSGRWVEGFALSPSRPELTPEDLEYQAVLGRGWLSPWAEGGQYCGSRGMALPILGLRVRLRGGAAASHTVQVSATFTDGTAIGPVGPGEACESEGLAPLEAFCVALVPLNAGALQAPAAKRGKPATLAKPPTPAPAPKPSSVPKAIQAKQIKPTPTPVQAPRRSLPGPSAKPAPRGRGR